MTARALALLSDLLNLSQSPASRVMDISAKDLAIN
jgi:hypothetical protein